MKILGKYLGFTDSDIPLTPLLSSVLRQYCMNYAALSNEETVITIHYLLDTFIFL